MSADGGACVCVCACVCMYVGGAITHVNVRALLVDLDRRTPACEPSALSFIHGSRNWDRDHTPTGLIVPLRQLHLLKNLRTPPLELNFKS